MKNRPQKGDFNYLSWQKKFTLIRTLAYFLIVFAVFLIGYITTKTRNNLLTVVAILGVLPAGKSLVNTIMFLRFKPAAETLKNSLKEAEDKITILYNMMISSSEKIYFADCIAISNHSVYLYITNEKTDEKKVEKYLKNVLSNHGKGNVNIKAYKSSSEFLSRLKTAKDLQSNEENADFEEKIADILKSFCL